MTQIPQMVTDSARDSAFEFRISNLFRISYFGFRISILSKRIPHIAGRMTLMATLLSLCFSPARADAVGLASAFPRFSWDKVPVYQMFAHGERLLEDSEVREIASISGFICIEKQHGFKPLGGSDLGTRHEIPRFKAIDPNLKCLFYFNSAFAYTFVTYSKVFGFGKVDDKFKSFLITDPATGELAHRGHQYLFDVLNPEFRKWWADTAGRCVRESGADGLFVDQMHGFAYLRPQKRTEVAKAQAELMRMAKTAIGPDRILLLNNAADIPELFAIGDAFMLEHYDPKLLSKEAMLKDWALLKKISEANKIAVWRIGVEIEDRTAEGGASKPRLSDAVYDARARKQLPFYLAAFLIGAQPYSYFQYGWGWELKTGPLAGFPEFKRPLGKPLGDFTRPDPNGWIFRREFEHASVWLDLNAREGKIEWKSAAIDANVQGQAFQALEEKRSELPIVGNSAPAPAKSAQKPNIVFILADDLSYGDLGCFGQTNFATPNIDRLARDGRLFANAYAGGPWCAPSRTALLTGRNAAHAVPLEHDKAGQGTRFNPTVAEMLKTAGYTTCALGKWHMQEGPRETWLYQKTWEAQKAATNWRQMPWHRGFDVCRIGYRCGFLGSNGNPYFPQQIETGDRQEIAFPENRNLDIDCLWKYTPARYDADGRFLDKAGRNSAQLRYAEDYYREEAVAFMRANKDKPFFLYYATPLVHGPLNVKQLAHFEGSESWNLQHKLWATMVRELDRSVGAIVDEVNRLGIGSNTVVFFASDNGYAQWGYFGRKAWTDDPVFHNKGPWNRGKFANANGGLIVPFIAWGPGRVPAGRTERAVCFYDLMATARELADAKSPGPTDGASVLPLLEGRDKDQPLRAAIAWAPQGGPMTFEDDFNASDRMTRYAPPAVLLDERWYALGFQKKPGDPRTIRLFDIAADPGCTNDLSAVRQDLCARATTAFKELEVHPAARSATTPET